MPPRRKLWRIYCFVRNNQGALLTHGYMKNACTRNARTPRRRRARPEWLAASFALLLSCLCLSAIAGEDGAAPSAPAKKDERNAAPLPATVIELDGSISSSPDGGEIEYRWRQLSGPAATLSDPTAAKPYFSTVEPGTYVFELVVSANGLDSEPHIVQLEIEAENLPPVAKVPRELVGMVGKALEVDGSDSFDPEGRELRYRWRPLSPGLELPKQERRNPVLTFEPDTEGVFEVELRVNDGELTSEPAICRLTIKPQPKPPVARARVSTLEAKPDTPPSGKTASELTKYINDAAVEDGSGVPLGIVKPPVAAKAPAEPVAELAAMAAPSFPVQTAPGAPIAPPPPLPAFDAATPPVARIRGPAVAEAGTAVVLDARDSFNPSGNRMEYRWRQTAGPLVSGLEVVLDGAAERFTATLPGEYAFELVVVDGGLPSEPVTHRMRIDAAPEPPVAIVAAPATVSKGELVRMDATGSRDPSGKKLIYRWRQTGGPAVRNYIIDDSVGDAAPAFNASAPGTYSFELIVSNGSLNSKPAEVDIVVLDAALTPAVAISGPKAAKVGDRVALDAIPTNLDGRTVSYLWRQVEGPVMAMPQGGGMRAFVIPPLNGRYVFMLTALENGQAVAMATSTLDVYAGDVPRAVAAPVAAGRVPELAPLPNTPAPRPPPPESFPPAGVPSAGAGRPAAQVLQGTRYGG